MKPYYINFQKKISKIFLVGKFLRSGGYFFYYYGYYVKLSDVTIICLNMILRMFQMSKNLDMFIPKDPCDVFGRDIHYLLS